MMKGIFLAALITVSSLALAQKRSYNLMFNENQVTLTPEQEKELLAIAQKSQDGELVTIFPLTLDKVSQKKIFAKIADKQAAEISKYATSIGFRVFSTPSNFPSGYSGRSYSVNMKLVKKLTVISETSYFPVKPSQYFLINPNRDTTIIGNEGTKLHFPVGCLQTKYKVRVELKEYYSMSDYIKSSLPTVSNGKMIETGGVIYLNATTDILKKQVKINSNKGIGAEFTQGKNKAKMQVYVKDPRTKELNWIVQDSLKYTSKWTMTETIVDEYDNVISQVTYNSKEDWEKHLKEEEAKQKAVEKKEKIQQQAAVNKDKTNKMLELFNFGFINCDRFINEPQKPYVVKLNEATDSLPTNYYLVFNDIRSVMTGSSEASNLNFGNVPINRKAVLVAISFVGKQAYFFSSPVTTGTNPKLNINLKPVDDTFINAELAKLK